MTVVDSFRPPEAVMSSSQGKDFVLTDYAQNLIKVKAYQLRRRRDFRSVEPEDLRQELWLALFKAADQFDPAKASLDTFIDRVVNTAVAMLVRGRRRQKNGNGHGIESLDGQHSARSNASEPRSASVTAADLARRIGLESRDEASEREDAEAIVNALTQIPEATRDVCRRLMGGSVASVARDLGISRRQVRNAFAVARPYMERAGFSQTAGQVDGERHT
jgi:RNA polymerase sigma-70 factor, ECF subfamily